MVDGEESHRVRRTEDMMKRQGNWLWLRHFAEESAAQLKSWYRKTPDGYFLFFQCVRWGMAETHININTVATY